MNPQRPETFGQTLNLGRGQIPGGGIVPESSHLGRGGGGLQITLKYILTAPDIYKSENNKNLILCSSTIFYIDHKRGFRLLASRPESVSSHI